MSHVVLQSENTVEGLKKINSPIYSYPSSKPALSPFGKLENDISSHRRMKRGGKGGNCPLDSGKILRKFGQIQRKFGQNNKRKNPPENIKLRAHTMLHTHAHTNTLSIEQK